MNEFESISNLFDALGVKAVFAPLLAIIFLLFLAKKYVFAGWGDLIRTVIENVFQREKDLVRIQTEVAGSLEAIVKQLEALTKKVSDDIRESNERIRALEFAMSDYLDEFRTLNQSLEQHPPVPKS